MLCMKTGASIGLLGMIRDELWVLLNEIQLLEIALLSPKSPSACVCSFYELFTSSVMSPRNVIFALASYLSSFPIIAVAVIVSQSIRELKLDYGFQATNEIKKLILAPPEVVRTTIGDVTTWPSWISPGIRHNDIVPAFLRSGDEFTEQFGVFDSSKITWKAQIVTRSNIALFTKEKVNTFGWDEISMNYKLQENGKVSIPMNPSSETMQLVADAADEGTSIVKDSTLLTFTYTWIVGNPWISWLEKKFVRQSMVDDNILAMNKLGEICEAKTSLTKI